ncbi:ribose-phosphate diphosphokinase [Roseibium salinum]|uniref:Ribose-phosphate diphosphokinase n=1 Tax=Roseibium salinum TaxID=1604349 RepID=A0ABT3QVI4_9HYPH|nr:ribose-phosphate diphosphokinase [Roseibium sp. DSM 29163]MCX2720931.1 ribose-phosphate diphosphokinase [Roseibium sp. DSM 29163]MDN3722390.1 ribose-phosphate diphosphokinase [Roseibium salinum]
MTRLLIPFPDMAPLAEELGSLLDANIRPLGWHQFPDGESLVTLPAGLDGADVAIVACLRDPDRSALPLRFAAATARNLGARQVGLIAPYLAYMRQDRRFHDGEAVSARLFADFLAESFDWLVTVDPHLHRIRRLGELFPMPAVRAASAPLLADWIRVHVPDAVLLGPDSESRQWVAEVARLAHRPFQVLAKIRHGDHAVDISVPDADALCAGVPVILDDVASSGRTLMQTLQHLGNASTRPPVCLVIHAVFAGSAYDDILAAGASRVVTTNTIPHPSNAISVASLLAYAIQDVEQCGTGSGSGDHSSHA